MRRQGTKPAQTHTPGMEEQVSLANVPKPVPPSERTLVIIDDLHYLTKIVYSEDRYNQSMEKTFKPLQVDTIKYRVVP